MQCAFHVCFDNYRSTRGSKLVLVKLLLWLWFVRLWLRSHRSGAEGPEKENNCLLCGPVILIASPRAFKKWVGSRSVFSRCVMPQDARMLEEVIILSSLPKG